MRLPPQACRPFYRWGRLMIVDKVHRHDTRIDYRLLLGKIVILSDDVKQEDWEGLYVDKKRKRTIDYLMPMRRRIESSNMTHKASVTFLKVFSRPLSVSLRRQAASKNAAFHAMWLPNALAKHKYVPWCIWGHDTEPLGLNNIARLWRVEHTLFSISWADEWWWYYPAPR